MHITAIEKRPQVALDADKTDSAKTYNFQLQVVNRSALQTCNSKKFFAAEKSGQTIAGRPLSQRLV